MVRLRYTHQRNVRSITNTFFSNRCYAFDNCVCLTLYSSIHCVVDWPIPASIKCLVTCDLAFIWLNLPKNVKGKRKCCVNGLNHKKKTLLCMENVSKLHGILANECVCISVSDPPYQLSTNLFTFTDLWHFVRTPYSLTHCIFIVRHFGLILQMDHIKSTRSWCCCCVQITRAYELAACQRWWLNYMFHE